MKLLLALGYRLLVLLACTLRYRIDDRANIAGQPADGACLFTTWHNRLLLLPYVVRRFVPARKPTALVSASKDGSILADMIQRFGFGTVAGSSSRRGAAALRQLSEIVAAGGDLAITPDGPRGPVYRLSGGVVFIAQKTGAPVVPAHMEFSSCWRMKSWDRFIVPKPFSTVRVTFGERHHVRATTNEEEFEAERLRLEEAMKGLVQKR